MQEALVCLKVTEILSAATTITAMQHNTGAGAGSASSSVSLGTCLGNRARAQEVSVVVNSGVVSLLVSLFVG